MSDRRRRNKLENAGYVKVKVMHANQAEPAPQAPDAVASRDDDWRAARALNVYRWLVAAGLCLLLAAGYTEELITLREPALFTTVCIAYLLTCIPSTLAIRARRPPLHIQVSLLVGADIGFVTLLVFASNGIGGGLGMLLLAPVAGASLLVPRRMAALFAALASIGLILQEIYGTLLFEGSDEFVQGGILGTLLFISALVANALAHRARSSAVLAEVRKSALDDLAVLNDRIIQQMAIGLLLVDEERRVRLCNRAARYMLDLDRDPTGQPLSSTAPALSRALDAWWVSPGPSSEPFDVGQRSLIPRFNRLDRGANTPVLIFLEDARRLSEQAQQMKLAALGRLTASIAHEIRNPLSAISHAGQLLDESGRIGEDERRLLAMQHRHTGRIEKVVQSVLGLSRRDQALPTFLNLAEWLPLAVGDYRHSRPRQAPRFELSNVDETVTVQADESHLRQILHNLWENAERHARLDDRELTVFLRAGYDDDEPFLDVADNGPGIPEKAVAHLMEPFFTTANDGTGLGLYIARELCECNFARIVLMSRGGEAATGEADRPAATGARFRITFARQATEDMAVPG